jgi:hypothetical protein
MAKQGQRTYFIKFNCKILDRAATPGLSARYHITVAESEACVGGFANPEHTEAT